MTHFTYANIQKAFDLSDEVFEGLRTYHSLLIKWQKAINIVSKKTLDDAWHRHFADSAQIARLIPVDDDKRIYTDLGCGGGFPGLVVAMMRPDLEVHLVESDERKGQFMRTVMREVGISNATVHARRIEDMTDIFVPDYVSARALASLARLLDYCHAWVVVNPDVRFYFLKGRQVEDEIADARAVYDFELTAHSSVTDEQAQIIALDRVISSLRA
ncbi:MAG: 16S rRNA (guanine(527)-N(7))-methyltransferase RsmG [Alphaproteobacteria bacterium]